MSNLFKYFDVEHTAVLVVDKQNAYFTSGEEVQKIDDFIIASRELGAVVIWTQMLEHSEFSPNSFAAIIDPAWQFEKSDPEYAIVGLEPKDTETVIQKRYYDCFSKTNLEELLRKSHITTLLLVGGYAGRCILATAFVALSKGFAVTIAEELIRPHPSNDGEEEVVLRIFSDIIGVVEPSETILRAWQEQRKW